MNRLSVLKKIKLSREIIGKIVSIITSNLEVEKIIIFGSKVLTKCRNTSDIDIAIQSKESPFFLKEILEEELNTLLKIDVVDLKKIDSQFKAEILKKGVVIFEKTKVSIK